MEKSIIDDEVYYHIVWSQTRFFDKYQARGIPEMPGIVCLLYQKSSTDFDYLLFFSCWRNGLRIGLREITDSSLTKFPKIIQYIETKNLLYKYSVVDTGLLDMNDIMYWLIKEYQPEFNNTVDFEDSGRYKNIFLKESIMRDKDVIDRTHRIRS